ncbi:MAG TPA: GTP cyclohydrolase II [Planctomycetota bacterium]|jgi:3,4-dihydroxy 2-butanone 4-phosphate synthase/GTP cyclohydrolase II|nr:GTP cyclohydrolase II [Planctomycetota bacterium]
MPFASIPDILEELRAGRMVILVDDPRRENEGDLVIAAEKVTPEAINFMRKCGGGLICLSLAPEICDRLRLHPQAIENTSRLGTAFTVSIEAKEGVSTGISAADRAHTILTAIRDDCRPEDLVRPGHVFPLRAREGGALVRPGQTEGSVDLCRLAGLKPAGVLCEVLKEDGSMARLPDLEEFAEKHGLRICAVADIIQHRRRSERLIQGVGGCKMPTAYGLFDLVAYYGKIDHHVHMALTRGIAGPTAEGARAEIEDPVLVRVHSECLTGDAFGSLKCDCGPQLRRALEIVGKAERGVVLYMRQEGRGIGLLNKVRAYALQETGLDTVEANEVLGFLPDERDYGIGSQILFDLGIRRLRLLTNNPNKPYALSGYGLEIVERVPLQVPANPENRRYLETKRKKLGHVLDEIEQWLG